MIIAKASSGGIGISIFIAILITSFFYFIPTIVAAVRRHQLASVLVINLFLGWTLIGWVVAMALAVGNSSGPVPANYSHPPGYPPQGYPPQGYPPQGYPSQGYPPQGYPPSSQPGYPTQGYPPQDHPPQGYPPQGYPPSSQPGHPPDQV